jgi:molybdate transport system regulatory protein
LFKESEVSIAKNFSGLISLQNRFDCIITRVELGKLLAQITLNFHGNIIDSIISSGSAKRMNLAVGDSVVALVKSTEITLIMDNEDE